MYLILLLTFPSFHRTPGMPSGPLWASTAAEALRLAVEAQPTHSPWPMLLHRACQPRLSGSPDEAAVVAGLVLGIPLNDGATAYLCVALGSGTRCTGATVGDSLEAYVIRDGHAEVMARRAFAAYVLESVEALAKDVDATHPFLVRRHTSFTVRDGVTAHLVSTRWMCGSMSAAPTGGRLLLRTPNSQLAPSPPEPEESNDSIVHVHGHILAAHRSAAESYAAYTHATRVKPGRGPPNLNMSCSDKVWRWSIEGLLGSRWAVSSPSRFLLSHIHVVGSKEEATYARSSLEAKNSWLPQLSQTGIPVIEALLPAALSVTVPADQTPTDSSFSRAAWISVQPPSARPSPSPGEKRGRDSPRTPPPACHGTWVLPDGSAARQVTLNMKAGLPQGSSRQALEVAAAKPEGWRRYPLSRAWLQQRLGSVQHSCPPSWKLPCSPTLPSRRWRHCIGVGAVDPLVEGQRILWVSKERLR